LVLLSIITPCYNPGSWLEKCILNVAQNHLPEIEHLIIDGGSNDGSVEKLTELSHKFPHIRWISENDKGQSDAMNKGLALAKGPWIGFLNVDDYYEAGALSSVLAHIGKNPSGLRLLTGNLNIINENGALISRNKPDKMSFQALLADMCEWPYNPSSYFYPAAVHDKIGKLPVDEHFAMDYDFILKLMAAGIPIDYQNETWGNFRLLPDAKTGKDQAANQSYKRAEELRKKYTAEAANSIKIQVGILKIIWAIRNKLLGTGRKLFGIR
jgi:glycosyltransferase involved in cell wall biosynthesis